MIWLMEILTLYDTGFFLNFKNMSGWVGWEDFWPPALTFVLEQQ